MENDSCHHLLILIVQPLSAIVPTNVHMNITPETSIQYHYRHCDRQTLPIASASATFVSPIVIGRRPHILHFVPCDPAQADALSILAPMMTLPQRANTSLDGHATGYARFIRSLDAFSRMMKVPEDLRTQSTTGGTISLISFVVITLLVLSELISFLTPERTTKLSVDTGVGETLRIFVDVDFPHVNCEIMGVDALDVGGTLQLEITNHMYKTPIDHHGHQIENSVRSRLQQHPPREAKASPSPWPKGCGSCMGAQLTNDQCCNTCESVRKAYEARGWLLTDLSGVPQCAREGVTTLTPGTYDPSHGCNIHGHLDISKVAGRIHITPGHSFQFHGHTLHDLSVLRDHQLDLSHKINRLSFGEPYPGQVNPLDGVQQRAATAEDKVGQHEYFIRIVPTTYKYSFSRPLRTNQYSQSYFFKRSDPNKGSQAIPGLFLVYDLSPIHIEVEESRRSFFHFLVQLCAIIGGVFTVASMLSTFMDDVVLRAVRKRQTGKQM